MSIRSLFSKIWKFNYNFDPILYNRPILYTLTIMNIFQIIYFMNIYDIESVIVHIVVALLLSFFNKNMVVIEFFTLVISNVIKYGINPFRRYEGFTDSKEKEEKEKDMEEKKVDNVSDDKMIKVDDKIDEKDKEKIEEHAKLQKELEKEFPEFKKIQSEILKGVSTITPLLDKADDFIEKFNNFKKNAK